MRGDGCRSRSGSLKAKSGQAGMQESSARLLVLVVFFMTIVVVGVFFINRSD